MLEEMMPRWVPTENVNGFEICPGLYRDEGATAFQSAVNFTVHSKGAVTCELLLFHRKEPEPYAVIPFPENCRIGDVFSMMVFGLDIEEFEYAYRLDGPWKPKEGLLFDKKHILLDPYAKAVTGQSVWGKALNTGGYRARVVRNNFFWGSEKPDKIPMEKLIIYEMHVRGFTKMDKSVRHPGTFAGIKEKIPYLKTLGINAVELMPIFEFDELQGSREVDGKKLIDYWGYNTVSFFAPNTSYAASTEYNREGVELKELIRELHDNQIEVILDVVFNHTAEGNECGPFISFKGFDNQIYYMLTPDGKYYNFSGCGNTVNCNHPVVIKMIQDCLRYWVAEYRVDGFRFDLASILGRNEDGSPMENPPLVKNLAYDSLLADTKLIAEAWDAGGLYQVGSFPAFRRWSEWNGRYRDDVREYLKGGLWAAGAALQRIAGSPDIYDTRIRGKHASVNFLTCHDGFKEFGKFSKGMKMKLGIAVALSHHPKLLILDEATSGLDPVMRDEILDIFNDFTRDESHAILISSHIVSDLEKICDYVAFLHKGNLVLFEEKDRLLEKYGIIQCTKEQLQELDQSAVIGVKYSSYNVEAVVLRDQIPEGFKVHPISIEDLFIFMIKGVH